ncbi:hypothetical protein BYT27DRAFT_7260936 [Phlegmacium glaucopus]|nr:hypothetical protein BYT27DRAFT_7260936 [Phlegmacium glaucopus]
MPRTRNVTRAQWDAANASNSTTTRDQNHGFESEKENEGRTATRATRSQTRTRSNGNRVGLGSTTPASLRISTLPKGLENTANTTKAKGKGKAKAPPPKRKKLPLQDITSQFLPAPEAANRGEENEAAEHGILEQIENSVNFASPLSLAQGLGGGALVPMMLPAPTYLDSPLPPSSPPSEMTSSPQYPKILPESNTLWVGLSSYKEENNLWIEFDDGRPASHGSPSVISSSSDPFGFVALERKLKAQRTAAASSPLKRHHHQDEFDEDLGRILVADTSSPRLVRRLKRPLYQGNSPLPRAISEHPHPHYATPPTPHKDKKKRQRLSCEEDGVFSSSSSMPSTPSPSKPSAQKRALDAGREDTLDELTDKLNGNREVGSAFRKTRNRTGRGIVKGEPSTTSKSTMAPLELGAALDDDAETEGEQVDPKRAKATESKINTKKSRSTGTKKVKKEKAVERNDNDNDYAEKWEQERQERAAYFKRLEEYQVEKEDVYVI